MKSTRTWIVAAFVMVTVLIGVLWVLELNQEPKLAPPSDQAVATDAKETPAPSPPDDPARTVETAKSGPVELAVPFLGMVPTQVKEQTVSWQSPEGRSMQFPFKFYYAENGVWIRAECVRGAQQYEDTTARDLQGMYMGNGETITGIPPRPTTWSVQRILTTASKRWNLEDATKIVLEYVMLKKLPEEEVEPWLMVKAWGVEVLGRSDYSAARILIKERTGEGWVDNAL